jgi:ABC-type multidrug transport system ATPase subunit
MSNPQEITIGNTPDSTYPLTDATLRQAQGTAVGNIRLTVIPLSASEYLIRNVSDVPDQLMVSRQRVMMARIDKFTPISIGKVHFTLGELIKYGRFISHTDNSVLKAPTHYMLEPERTYLAGASDICDISLPSPQVAWHAVEIKSYVYKWEVHFIHARKTAKLPGGSSIRIGPYQLEFNSNSQLSVQAASNDRLTLRNVDVLHPNKKYPLIRALSLAVQAGEFMGIIGPSGAGKSTLLKAIRAIIPIQSGQISLSNQNTRTHPDILKEIGFVPQDDVVIPELTVTENLRFAARLRLPADWPAAAIEQKVTTLIQAMNLDEQRYNYCGNISGGQRKRVNLALEMMLEPTFLLADEVCSGLSSLDTDNILQHLRRIADSGKGIMLTIHSPDIEAFDLMDTLLVLDTGGFIAYYGPAQPDAIQYFSKQRHSPYKSPKLIFDILEKKVGAERQTSPEEWHQIYRSSRYYREFIEAKLAETTTQ